MNKTTITHTLLLLLATVIWGFAFVAQSKGGEVVGAFTFTAVRFWIAAGVLGTVVLMRRKKHSRDVKKLLLGGALCGTLLALATNLQQLGLNMGSPVGKAGFITAMYIVLVPIGASVFFRKASGLNVWLAVAIGIVSLYLLCMNDDWSFATYDILMLGCALSFAFQILSIDKFDADLDPIELSCVQFCVCAFVSTIPMLIFELGASPTAWTASLSTWDAWIPLLYAAVLSGGMGYTLQTVGQKGINPTLASLVMSFESVFSVLAGWIILHQVLSPREWIGCALMMVAIVLAQIPLRRLPKEIAKEPADEACTDNGQRDATVE
jgi:drug/metabolite transporter (DMT)-like permease